MPKKTGVGFFISIVILGTILSGSILIYSLSLGHISKPNSSVFEKIYIGLLSGVDILLEQNRSINQSFSLSTKLNINQNKLNIIEGRFDIVDGHIYSNASGLNQSIGAEDIKFYGKINNIQKNISLGKMDIISDAENIYLDLGNKSGNFREDIIDVFLSYNLISPEYVTVLEKLKQINNDGKYGVIDNSDLLGENNKNVGVYKILLSLFTSNPLAYLQENNLDIQIKKDIYNGSWIEKLFIPINEENDSKRIVYILDPDFCSRGGEILYHAIMQKGNINGNQDKKTCENFIEEIQPFMMLVSQIYILGEKEKGNYDFIISQGSNITMRFSYINNVLKDWNIDIQDINKYGEFNIQGNTLGLQNSELTLDYKKGDQYISGKVVNGNGKINFHYGDGQILNGTILLQNYFPTTIDIQGAIEVFGETFIVKLLGDEILGIYSSHIQGNYNEKNINIQLDSKKSSNSQFEVTFNGDLDGDNLFSGKLGYQKGQIQKINGNFIFPSDDIRIDFSTELETEKISRNFILPIKTEKIENKIFTPIILPSFHVYEYFQKPLISFSTASLGVMRGTFFYFENMGVSREEKNETLIEVIDELNTGVEKFLEENPDLPIKNIIGESYVPQETVSIRIGGEKIPLGEKYVIGKVNWEVLEENFMSGSIQTTDILEYKEQIEIATIQQGNKKSYQILGYLDETAINKKAYIVGNYNPREFIRYDFKKGEGEENILEDDEKIEKQTGKNKIFVEGKHHIRIGDITSLGKVVEIDEGYIYIDGEINMAISKLYILGDDSASLFIENGKPVLHGAIQKK